MATSVNDRSQTLWHGRYLVALAFAPAALGSVSALAWLAAGARFDLDPFDSAELALTAVTAGLGHPPGQPFYTVLGWLITRGPWRPLVALTWLSIIPAAGLVATAVVRGIREGRAAAPQWARAAVAVPVSLLACTLPAVREVACRVEVYALAAALAICAVIASFRKSCRGDVAAGLSLGLSVAVNPVVAAQAAVAPLFAAATRSDKIAALGRTAAGVFAGMSTYAYALMVARRETVTIVWEAPHDVASFLRLITAHDFQRNVSLSATILAGNLARLAWSLTRSGVLPYLALGALGLSAYGPKIHTDGIGSVRQRSSLSLPFGVALAVGALMIAANVPYRPANPDYGGYLLVPIGLASAGWGRLCVTALGEGAKNSLRVGVLLAALVVLSLAVGGHGVWARPSGATRALATLALDSAPPRALVVLQSDHLLFPALYLQRVEQVRTDVTVLNPGWASSRWAWRYAMARDPLLSVDLTPGLGRDVRLVSALRSRPDGRAVTSETLSLLRAAAPGAVCSRGITWSSSEGCSRGTRQSVERAVALLQREAVRAPTQGWDRKLLAFTARSMGDQALALGCAGLAQRYYSAGLGRVAAAVPACDGKVREPLPAPSVLEITDGDLVCALERLSVP